MYDRALLAAITSSATVRMWLYLIGIAMNVWTADRNTRG